MFSTKIVISQLSKNQLSNTAKDHGPTLLNSFHFFDQLSDKTVQHAVGSLLNAVDSLLNAVGSPLNAVRSLLNAVGSLINAVGSLVEFTRLPTAL